MRCIMRIRSCSITLFVLLCFFCCVTEAYCSLLNTDLVYSIKPNPKVSSKPTSIKLASVSFLQSDTNLSFGKGELDVKTQCAALGYTIPKSSCSGVMQSGKPCSDEASMSSVAEAENYVLSCCNSQLYTVDNPDKCENNSVALSSDFCEWGGKKMYRCKCDRTQYPYGDDHSCANGEFNAYSSCSAPVMSGGVVSSKTFYSSCCPSSYQVCNNKYVGDGRFCGVDTGGGDVELRFENCKCSSSYDTICDGMMIDPTDYCEYDGRFYTRDNNCEGSCNKTSETNLDKYLHEKVWHCLYKDDGASVKASEGLLCDGYNQFTSNVETNYYDECVAQGYTKSKDDCYISDLILYCPSDSSKVWCLDSKYCTGYDVGTTGGVDACGAGVKSALVKFCGSRDKGVRCKYDNEECNKCWNDGEYNSANCQNLDTSPKGDSEKCCSKGYVMRDGVCKANNCATQTDSGGNLLYPYANKSPGDDAGELEVCFQGNPNATLGYDTYYGYKSCYDDSSKGGMWMQSVDNPRKCVCNRKDDVRGWLPFDSTRYFDTNGDESNNFSNIGFKEGIYGVQNSCTDSEGSYYGYSSCFIGSYMGTSDANKGMCLSYARRWHTTRNPYELTYQSSIIHADLIFNASIGKGISAPSKPTTNNLPDYDKVYCINQRQHCPNNECDDADVLAMTYNPETGAQCVDGVSEECGHCYHVINIEKINGQWKWHGKFKFLIYTYGNGNAWFGGFERCSEEDGYIGGFEENTYGTCFKYCSKDNLVSCKHGDIITSTGDENGFVVGVVYYTTNSQVYIASLIHARSKNQEEAILYASNYELEDKSDSRFAKGKWHLPTRNQVDDTRLPEFAMRRLNGSYNYLGKSNLLESSWTGEIGYMRNCCNSSTISAVSKLLNAVPVIVCPINGGECS